jgi:hypothetical protein
MEKIVSNLLKTDFYIYEKTSQFFFDMTFSAFNLTIFNSHRYFFLPLQFFKLYPLRVNGENNNFD